ncbi:hypothetical protein [Catellatospora sp. TT07R-123]|uniref:hypothetical protein n=1 Tax=Catellatospora sp. TT07R-123 TaxID=2733863 RepID=UPI001BB36076|nr:hypothetical protein [Catellatospora sp. TT07R-123]
MPLDDAPNVTDWIQAVSGLVGSFLALPAVALAGYQLAQEQRARREDEREKLAAQARLVIGKTTSLSLPNPPYGDAASLYNLSWKVRNYSEHHIAELHVSIYDEVNGQDYPYDRMWDVLSPNGEAAGTSVIPLFPNEDPDQSQFAVELMFVDSAGRWWRRSGREMPLSLTPHPDGSGWLKPHKPAKGRLGRFISLIRKHRPQRYADRGDDRDPFYLRED